MKKFIIILLSVLMSVIGGVGIIQYNKTDASIMLIVWFVIGYFIWLPSIFWWCDYFEKKLK